MIYFSDFFANLIWSAFFVWLFLSVIDGVCGLRDYLNPRLKD